jgi:hypothetical protein
VWLAACSRFPLRNLTLFEALLYEADQKKIIVFIILGALSIIFLSWYSAQHSMEEARPMEINDKGLPKRVLIATQGSKFKDAVVQETIGQLK